MTGWKEQPQGWHAGREVLIEALIGLDLHVERTELDGEISQIDAGQSDRPVVEIEIEPKLSLPDVRVPADRDHRFRSIVITQSG